MSLDFHLFFFLCFCLLPVPVSPLTAFSLLACVFHVLFSVASHCILKVMSRHGLLFLLLVFVLFLPSLLFNLAYQCLITTLNISTVTLSSYQPLLLHLPSCLMSLFFLSSFWLSSTFPVGLFKNSFLFRFC